VILSAKDFLIGQTFQMTYLTSIDVDFPREPDMALRPCARYAIIAATDASLRPPGCHARWRASIF
jgi:hypothetical protein